MRSIVWLKMCVNNSPLDFEPKRAKKLALSRPKPLTTGGASLPEGGKLDEAAVLGAGERLLKAVGKWPVLSKF